MSTTPTSSGDFASIAEMFARGLLYLANVDGLEAREEKLLKEFLEEAGLRLKLDKLAAEGFSPQELAQVIDTTHMRRIFIKAAIAMVKADGKFSDGERHALGEIADAFGLSNAEFGDLEQEAGRVRLE
jgi:tellurite resistance protein